jgi:hypothetical protein
MGDEPLAYAQTDPASMLSNGLPTVHPTRISFDVNVILQTFQTAVCHVQQELLFLAVKKPPDTRFKKKR